MMNIYVIEIKEGLAGLIFRNRSSSGKQSMAGNVMVLSTSLSSIYTRNKLPAIFLRESDVVAILILWSQSDVIVVAKS